MKTLRMAMISRIVNEVQRGTSEFCDELLNMIDEERQSGIPGIVRNYDNRASEIKADPNLSELGQQSRIEAAAVSALGNLSALAKRIVQLEKKHESEKFNAYPIKRADISDTLIDLELIKYVKSQEMIPSKLEWQSERIRLALVRNPVELSGISLETQNKIHATLIPNHLAARLESESQILESSRRLMQTAIEDLAPIADLQPAKLVEWFDDDWQLPGVTATMTKRLSHGENSALMMDEPASA